MRRCALRPMRTVGDKKIMKQQLSLRFAAVLIALVALFTASGISQQANAPGGQQQASAARVPSPEVHADRRVTFRLYAPKASEVILHGDWYAPGNGTEKMTKGDDGVWSLTVGPLDPNMYVYWFDVDGMNFVVDPKNP